MSANNPRGRPMRDPTALRLSEARPSLDASRRSDRVISAIERRGDMRYRQQVVATCRIVDSERGEPREHIFPAEVVDLSEEGVGLRIDNGSNVIDPATACGTSMAVEVPTPADQQPLCLEGIVRWCKPDRGATGRVVRLGIEIRSQDARTRRNLADLVAQGKGDQQLLWNLWEAYTQSRQRKSPSRKR